MINWRKGRSNLISFKKKNQRTRFSVNQLSIVNSVTNNHIFLKNIFVRKYFRIGLFFIFLLSLFSVFYSLWFLVFRSHLFAFTTFEVTSFDSSRLLYADKEKIKQQSSTQIGGNLLAIDSSKINRTFSHNLWIKKIEVKKILPNTLAVKVMEFTPQIMVELGDLYLADRSGFLFKRVGLNEIESIPLLKGINRHNYQLDPKKYQAWIQRAIYIKNFYQIKSNLNLERPLLKSIQIELNSTKDNFDFVLIIDGGSEIWINENQLELDKIFLKFDRIWSECKRIKNFPVKIVFRNQKHSQFISVKNINEQDFN